MTRRYKYKCGHVGEPIILDNNPISATAYLEWKETAGFEGDKSQCWECWCKHMKASAANRKWRKNNPEKVREKNKKWRKNNPDRCRELNKKWRENNPKKVRELVRRWRKNNPKKFKAAVKKWQKKNPEKFYIFINRQCSRKLLHNQLTKEYEEVIREAKA